MTLFSYKKIFILLSLLVFNLHSFADNSPTQQFTSFINANIDAPVLSELEQKNSQKYSYVFIAGFLNEGLLSYFKDNIDVLEEMGISKSDIHVIRPSSSQSIEENIPYFKKKLEEVLSQSKKPLILFAHSKGGAEALALALREQDFTLKNIEKMFLIQAAIGGSAVADFIHHEGHKIDNKLPLKDRIFFNTSAITGQLLDPIINKGMGSLTHKKASALWKKLQSENPPLPKAISDKIFYINSKQDVSKMAEAVDCTGAYIQTYYSDNDGLVEVKDQYLKGVGTRLTVIDADHADLMTPFPISNDPKKIRISLMYSLIQFLALP